MANIGYCISTLDVGGVETQLLEVSKRLDRKQFTPFVFCLTRGGPMLREFRESGIEVCILKRRAKFDPTLPFQLASALKQRNIDIVHTFMFTGNTWGTLGARLAGVRKIVWGIRDIDTWKRRHHILVQRFFSGFATAIIANSRATADFALKHERLPPEKMEIIHNGVDISPFDGLPSTEDAKSALGLDAGKPVIGYVGRLDEPKKGLAFLLEAVSLLKNKHPGIQVLIAGDGPSSGELRAKAGKLALADNIRWLGMRRDIPRILAAMDIFVLPSLWEGFGNAVVEAMAAGRAVVASNTGGIPEIIRDGVNGKLVPPGDSRAISDAIHLLLSDHSMRLKMAEESARTARQDFRMEKQLEALQQVYRRLAHPRS